MRVFAGNPEIEVLESSQPGPLNWVATVNNRPFAMVDADVAAELKTVLETHGALVDALQDLVDTFTGAPDETEEEIRVRALLDRARGETPVTPDGVLADPANPQDPCAPSNPGRAAL